MAEQTPDTDEMTRRARRRPRRGILISVALVVAVAGVVAVIAFALPKQKREAAPTGPRPVNVEVMTLRPIPLVADTFVAHGDVEPFRVVDVSAEVSARVEELPVAEGQEVKHGDVLARLNTDLLQAEADRTGAQAAYDQREYRRLLETLEQGAATQKEADEARSEMQMSQAEHEAAAARLRRATIEAPIDGVLNRRPVERGEYVAPGAVVAQIVDSRTVRVAVAVSERDVHFLRTGERADVLHDRGGATGTITYISELADEQTRTSRVEVTVANPTRALRSGQMLRVRFTRRVLNDVLMIPLDAVVRLETGRAVYVVEQGVARRREVALAPPILGQWIWAVGGLSPGDRLVVEGRQYVGPGQPVKVVGEQPSPDADTLLRRTEAVERPAAEWAEP